MDEDFEKDDIVPGEWDFDPYLGECGTTTF